MRFTSSQQKNSPGFTLVEVLVSLSIFTMVATAAIGVLLVMIDANRKSQNIQSAMGNIAFALDSITREIRTGTNYYCGTGGGLLTVGSTNNCTAGASSLGFDEGGQSLTSACGGGRVAYRLNNGQVERSLCGSNTWQSITAGNVSIDTLNFVVTGAAASDDLAPTVTIYIHGTVTGIRSTGADFDLQTTITQQLLDI